ncbi:MAG: F0F1 ATP synthase subunit B [Pantoea sp. Brub]|nr:F0F1 ATP synthase subunit B [Pantoea sp. Brub]
MNINATIFGQVIAFILFVMFCMKYVWPPIIAAIDKRQKEINDNFNFIKQSKEDLKLAHIEAERQIQEAKEKARLIIFQANHYGNKIIEQTKLEANNERTRIISTAKIEIDSERKKIYEELRQKMIPIIILSVEKIIESSINKEDFNTKIINKLVSTLH